MANATWKGGSGSWDTETLWSTGVIPSAGDAVTIDASGSFTITENGTADAAGSLTLNDASATLLIEGTLAVSTTLADTAGTLELASGVIDGGTLVLGGTLIGAAGTLQGVTVLGPLALTGPGQSITIGGGIHLLGPGGIGRGTLALLGAGQSIGFADAETLDNVVISLGTAGGVFDVGSTLSLGPTTTLTTAGSFTEFGNPTGNPATLDNAGSIALTGANETLEIELDNFTNTGTISIGAGGELEINHLFGLPGSFSNTGTIAFASGGNLVIGDTLTAADLTGITLNGGSFLLEGAYENAGQTLTTTATGLLSNIILAFGTIIGGTIDPAAGELLSQGGTFDGVTWNANRLAPGGQLVLLHGLTFAPGSDTLDLITGGSVLARDAETLDNIFIPLGNNAELGTSGTGELSLGVNALTTLSSAGTATIGGDTVSNAGTILVSAGELAITATAFSNPGTIAVSGGTVDFAGSVTAASFGNVQNTGGTLELGGTLVNTGTTLTLPASGTFSNILLAGTIDGGTVQLAGGRIAFIRPAMLAGVTYDGVLDLSVSQAYVDISGGITLTGTSGTGPGDVLLTGAGAELELAGNATLDDATITAGDATISDQLSIDTTLTLGPALSLVDQGPGANLFIGGGDLKNAGTIAASAIGGTIEIDTEAFSNTGTISLAAGAVLQFDQGLTIADLGSIASTGGTINFAGGIFINTGSTLSITAGGAFSTVLFGGGAVLGGTIVVNGGTALFAGGELFDTTFDGAVDLSAAGSVMLIGGGITLHPTSGTGAGSIEATGAGGALIVTDTETLDNATITVGNAATADALNINFNSTLTLGANLLVQETAVGAHGSLGGLGAIVNTGTISANGAGGGLTINPSGGFSNLGTLAIADGGLLALNFNNGNAASAGTVTNLGGTFEILGTLDNTGSLIDITALSPFAGGLLGGLLKGGTIVMDGGTLEYPGNSLFSASGTLSGITVKGALDLSTAFATLFLTNGVSLVANGATAASVNETGAGAQLIASDNETLDNATFAIGNATSADVVDANTTLTFGAGLLLTETAAGAHASINGATIVNLGTILADAVGGGLDAQRQQLPGQYRHAVDRLWRATQRWTRWRFGESRHHPEHRRHARPLRHAGERRQHAGDRIHRRIQRRAAQRHGRGRHHRTRRRRAAIRHRRRPRWRHLHRRHHRSRHLRRATLGPHRHHPFQRHFQPAGHRGRWPAHQKPGVRQRRHAQQRRLHGHRAIATARRILHRTRHGDLRRQHQYRHRRQHARHPRRGLRFGGFRRCRHHSRCQHRDAGFFRAVGAGHRHHRARSRRRRPTERHRGLPAAGWIGSVGGGGGTLQVDLSLAEPGQRRRCRSRRARRFSLVQNFGTIADGTIVNAGSYQAKTSVLQDISFDGVLDLSAPGQREIEEDGLTLRGVDGTSRGTVLLTGLGCLLKF